MRFSGSLLLLATLSNNDDQILDFVLSSLLLLMVFPTDEDDMGLRVAAMVLEASYLGVPDDDTESPQSLDASIYSVGHDSRSLESIVLIASSRRDGVILWTWLGGREVESVNTVDQSENLQFGVFNIFRPTTQTLFKHRIGTGPQRTRSERFWRREVTAKSYSSRGGEGSPHRPR